MLEETASSFVCREGWICPSPNGNSTVYDFVSTWVEGSCARLWT